MDPPLEHANLEFYLTSASFLILIIYHVRLAYLVRRHPLTTSIGVTNHLRGHWVESIMADKRDILAVQTLRNWVMASSSSAWGSSASPPARRGWRKSPPASTNWCGSTGSYGCSN